MKKTNDWFFAGIIVGFIGGIAHLLWNLILLLLGVHFKPFWIAMAGIFYSPKFLYTLLAQAHGSFDAIGLSSIGGILLSATLKFTGKGHLYIKSIVLSAICAYFVFLIVIPLVGYVKDSPVVPWIALFGFIVFNGLLEGFILQKICFFESNHW